jgi:predicted ATPase
VGRENALSELQAHLDAGARLVTILGAPGFGKTRLLKRFGGLALGEASDVWFCDLTLATTLADLLATVAHELDLPLTAPATTDDLIAQIGRAIDALGPAVLLLDSFEQLVEHAEATVRKWLSLAPAVKILVSSRQTLGLDGEVRFELGPLPIAEAGTLFESRSRQVHATFLPSEHDRRLIAEIVMRLDGIPLAVELAAARMDVLDLPQILERLSRRFDLLQTSRRGVPARHATLERAIDWSWEVLSPCARAMLAQCSIFRGGFSLEAVEAVVELSLFPEAPPILDVIQALRERSLVYRSSRARGHLALYESIREYAARKIDAVASRDAAQRHARYYVTEGERCAALASGSEGQQSLEWLTLELENLLSVVHCHTLDPALRLRAAVVVDVLLARRGRSGERPALFEACSPLLDGVADRRLIVRYLRALAGAMRACGRLIEARSALERALEIVRGTGERACESRILRELGNVAFDGSEVVEARARYRGAIDAARHSGEKEALAEALGGPLEIEGVSSDEAEELIADVQDLPVKTELIFSAGIRRVVAGEFFEALERYERGRELAREIGDQALEMHIRVAAASIEHALGNLERAAEEYARVLPSFETSGNRRLAGTTLAFWGMLCAAEGRWEEAKELLQRGISLSSEVGDRLTEGIALATLAAVEAMQGRITSAERFLATAKRRVFRIDDRDFRADFPEAIEVLEGAVDLGRARDADVRGESAIAAERRASVQRRVEGLEASRLSRGARFGILLGGLVLKRALVEDPRGFVGGGLTPSAFEAAPVSPRAEGEALEVEREAMWFRARSAERVSLETHPALRRILLYLVEHRRATPGSAAPAATLAHVGWPGERILASARTNRLHNAIAVLRNLGLRGILRRKDTGYLLDPETPLSPSRP